MSRKHDWIRAYRRAASQRREAALILMRHSKHLDAVYLGGYAVECSLKALLLARTPQGQRETLLRTFRGRPGHDVARLRAAVRGRGVSFPDEVARALTRVESWSTDLRYQTTTLHRREAATFLAAVEAIMDWVHRSA